MTTTIQIENNTWKILNQMKQVGETFDEVIQRALKQLKQKEAKKQ